MPCVAPIMCVLSLAQTLRPQTLPPRAGLDTCVAIMRVLHGGFSDSKYRPCPLLVQYVDAGWWGKKVGKGVYEYPGWEPPHLRHNNGE